MKKVLIVLLLAGSLVGCTTTEQGTGIGAATGAGLGAIIGHQSGHTGEGALIGGAVGALGGYAVGNKMERKKFCPKCGRIYSANTVYCPYDGTKLEYQQK